MGGIGDSQGMMPNILGQVEAELLPPLRPKAQGEGESSLDLEGEGVLQSRPPGEEQCGFVEGNRHNLSRREGRDVLCFLSSHQRGLPSAKPQRETEGTAPQPSHWSNIYNVHFDDKKPRLGQSGDFSNLESWKLNE